ncbi:MAG: delta-lactam-biosynthetic de-N-acetylase [Oscillospiraceae bacterium]|nr:delta-lactam-biosynthetic de-N-acetylase [Oscillospiraceae bacterium]
MKIKVKRAAALLLAACVISVSTAALAANGSWGLSFKGKGQTPVGDATPEYLKQFDALYLGDTSQDTVYLTFDAGYENGYTPQILDALKKHEVSATFFLVGHYLESQPELVRRMRDEGHTVANHSYRHPDMSSLNIERFKKELNSLEGLFKEITGEDMPKLYRPPSGMYNEQSLKFAKDLGYKTVFWSVAYKDWINDKQPGREESLGKLMSRIHPGAIILLHSTSKTNAEILDEFLTRCKSEGYTFGRLEDIPIT